MSGLCAHCHHHAPGPKTPLWESPGKLRRRPVTVASCPDCDAWGVTARYGWICAACKAHREVDGPPADCATCARHVPLGPGGSCRMCHKQRHHTAQLLGVRPGAVGSILVLMLLISGIGYGGWTVLQELQRVQVAPVDQAPGVVAELDPIDNAAQAMAAQAEAEATGTTLSQGDAPKMAEAMDRLYRPQALDTPVLVARDGPIAAIDPSTTGALAGLSEDAAADAAVAEVTASLSVPPLGATPVQVVAADAPAVELLAVRPAWVRVQAADGTVLFEKILDAGERWALPKTEEAPTLRVGESGSLYFAVNGQTYGPAGQRGQVTKNLTLSPESLTSAYAVADLARDEDLARFVAVASAEPAQVLPATVDPAQTQP